MGAGECGGTQLSVVLHPVLGKGLHAAPRVRKWVEGLGNSFFLIN